MKGIDKKRIWNGTPWLLDHCLFAIKELDGLVHPHRMEFRMAAFWVQIDHLANSSLYEQSGGLADREHSGGRGSSRRVWGGENS